MSRRDQIRMSEAELIKFVTGSKTIILNSIAPDGYPHPAPMWFAVGADGEIQMTTFTKSQKIKNLERDPRASLLVEDGEVYEELRGVILYGLAELDQDAEKVADILGAITEKNGGAPGIDPDQLRAGLVERAQKRTGIRIRPEKVVSWDHRRLGGTY